MKKKDIFLIIGLLVVLAAAYFIFQMMQGEKNITEVYYHDEVIEQIDLSVDKTYEFEGDYGKFYLEVKDNQYHATNVECPNHDCEKIGWVKKGSSTAITCLPNQIYVVQSGIEEKY